MWWMTEMIGNGRFQCNHTARWDRVMWYLCGTVVLMHVQGKMSNELIYSELIKCFFQERFFVFSCIPRE